MKTKHSPESLAKIASDLQRQSYKKGWNDAVAALAAAVMKMADAAGVSAPVSSTAEPKRRATRGRHRKARAAKRGSARVIVSTAIRNNPGKTGTEIALLVADKVNKHTVRTQLRRLRLDNQIEQRDGRWYPNGASSAAA
jgi:hypothetical protein